MICFEILEYHFGHIFQIAFSTDDTNIIPVDEDIVKPMEDSQDSSKLPDFRKNIVDKGFPGSS